MSPSPIGRLPNDRRPALRRAGERSVSKIEKGTEDGGGTTLVDPAEGSDEAYGFSGASFATHVLSAAKKLGTSAKSMVVLAVFSLLFAASCFLDNYASGQQSAFDFLLLSALGGMGTAVVCFVLMVLIESLRIRLMRRDGVCRAAGKGRTRYFACALVAILLCWLFWWLLYYPGCTSVDSQDIMKMVLGLPYESDWFRYDAINSHHPLLYTAIVGAFVNAGSALGDVTWGVAALSFAQMCFLAFACAYCSNWLLKSTGSRAVFALTVAFFALNPLIARYAVTLWKDVLFAGTFLLFSLVFIEVVQTRGRILCRRSQTIQILILGACVMLLRSNGALVVVVALLIAALWCTRFRWRIIGGGLCSVFLVFALQGTVSASIGISPGHFAESVACLCSKSHVRWWMKGL